MNIWGAAGGAPPLVQDMAMLKRREGGGLDAVLLKLESLFKHPSP